LSEGSFVPNVVVQIPKFDAKPNPNPNPNHVHIRVRQMTLLTSMGAGTGGAGWASAHPGKNQGGNGPPWKF